MGAADVYFDSHCHLTDERFRDDVDDVLARARDAGVTGIVTIASDATDAERAVELSRAVPGLWATAGIHPHVAADARPGDPHRIRDLIESGAAVAVGETGLDYHYDNSPRDVQRRLFRAQAEMAVKLDVPLVVHTREAEDDTAALIREMGRQIRGVLHCYTSGLDLLEVGLDAGWYVSYSGIASFGSFGSEGEEGLRTVPDDRLLIETDAPYLAPDPVRGRRNEPAFVAHVAAAVARIRGEDAEELGRRTAENACRFYGIELED